MAAGLDQGRIATVIGKADTEHMVPDAPRDPRNRRISITLLRQEPVTAARHVRGVPSASPFPLRKSVEGLCLQFMNHAR